MASRGIAHDAGMAYRHAGKGTLVTQCARAMRAWSRVSEFPGHGDDGGSLLEFALVLPMLMVLLTGMFSFGIVLNNYIMLTHAVDASARQLAVSRSTTLDPCAQAYSALVNAAPNLDTSKITFKVILNGTSYASKSCSSTTTSTGAAGNLVTGSSAQVVASYPYTLSLYGWAPSSLSISAQTTELVQ